MTKLGYGKKPVNPEHEDLVRLSEAIANGLCSGLNLVLVTRDAHFRCYTEDIAKDFKVTVKCYN